MKKNLNPYRIPEKFPNVIKALNSLADSTPSRPFIGRFTYDDGDILVETKSNIHLITYDSGKGVTDISGCLANNRFNINIWTLIDLLKISRPRMCKELESFSNWVSAEKQAHDAKMHMEKMEADANNVGYTLRKIKVKQ